ncbi:hypothetical protein OG422_08465 [Streptomyces sp. NBC_01525]|uniref:hypothetical protein n=1 Tax=Streptomyces sp. NBC_01525 TaxID=2903893 RepID=UPI00386A79A9
MWSAKHGRREQLHRGPHQPSDPQPEEPMPRMRVGWMFSDDPNKTLDPGLDHAQRVLTVRLHNSTRAFVQSLIFGAALIVFGIAYRKFETTIGVVGVLAGVGTLAFGVRSLFKANALRRELRRQNQAD